MCRIHHYCTPHQEISNAHCAVSDFSNFCSLNLKYHPSSAAVLTFGMISAILLVVDASTGGQLKYKTADNKTRYGTWNPNGLFPVYIISGVSYGMVELIRRVIPRDIVGGDVQRVEPTNLFVKLSPDFSQLRRMDAVVHVLYEVAGTAGAFTSKSELLPLLHCARLHVR
jgi:hypothetical protein